MLIKSLNYAKIALIKAKSEDFLGYKQFFDQEKIPYEILEKPKRGYDLIIFPEESNIISGLTSVMPTNSTILISSDNVGPSFFETLFSSKILIIGPVMKLFIKCVREHRESPLKIKFVSRELRVLFNKFMGNDPPHFSRRDKRRVFKQLLKNLIGKPLLHVWYWPDDYVSCFSQRIDVDFPIKRFKQKDLLVKHVNKFLDETRIPCSLYLNHTFKKENDALIIPSPHEIESHGCTEKLKHRHYCYDLNCLSEEEISEMFNEAVVNKCKIFAPPCEHVNGKVLEVCEEKNIKWITGGHVGRDDVPHKVFLNREYDVFNIPTSMGELVPKFNPDKHIDEFRLACDDRSLYCVYFHPELLLDENDRNSLLILHSAVNFMKKRYKTWVVAQRELAEWWELRDKIYFKNGKIHVPDEIKDKVRIAHWSFENVRLECL